MNDKLLFLVFGAAFWVVGTIWYEWRGPQVFESGSQRYWINFVLTPVVTAALCMMLLRWRHVAAADWASAALLIALPGMSAKPCCSPASPRSCPECIPRQRANMEPFSSPPTPCS